MRLNKSTSHAIRILIGCARADGALVKVADLSSDLSITMQNVFKIVHILSRAELVTAVRGRNGGVRLARAAEQIRIGDIVRAMETTEIELATEAADGSPRRSAGIAGVNRVLDSALEAFISVLDRHTLADMAGELPETRRRGREGRGKTAKLAAAAPARRKAPARVRK